MEGTPNMLLQDWLFGALLRSQSAVFAGTEKIFFRGHLSSPKKSYTYKEICHFSSEKKVLDSEKLIC